MPFVARRDAEGRDILACLREELQPRKWQLIVLWGAGGVGKTTLAAEAARALIDSFAKRVIWTSALGRADYTLATLLDDVAAQLDRPDLRPLALDPKAEAVRALLMQAPTLVVLDNFETVTEAEQPRLAEFLKSAPASPLITTRQKIDDAYNIKIDAMSLTEARLYLQLLIAQTNDHDTFTKLDHDRIIETAACNALLLQWVVRQIDAAQEPATVLDDLTHGAGDAAERVFTRSFNLPQLTDDGRAALLALALFTPSAARPALAEVAGFDADVPRLNAAVKHLADLWLVKTADAGTRLTLEGLTRQLALARLEQDRRADDYRHRFVAHFLTYVEAHYQPTPEAYDALEAELDNLLAAMDTAEALHDWLSVIGVAGVLGNPEGRVLYVRGHWDEAIRRNEQGARAAEAAGDEGAAVMLAANAATIRLMRGEYAAARAAYERALAVLRQRGDEQNVAVYLHQLGMLAQEQCEYAEARRHYDESLVIAKKFDNQSGIAMTLHQLGQLAQKQGERAEARRLFNESLAITKTLSNQSLIAMTLHHLAMLAADEGEREEARRLYHESLAIKETRGDQRGIAATLRNLGLLAERDGDRAEAARLTREALRIHERLGLPDADRGREYLARLEMAGE